MEHDPNNTTVSKTSAPLSLSERLSRTSPLPFTVVALALANMAQVASMLSHLKSDERRANAESANVDDLESDLTQCYAAADEAIALARNSTSTAETCTNQLSQATENQLNLQNAHETMLDNMVSAQAALREVLKISESANALTMSRSNAYSPCSDKQEEVINAAREKALVVLEDPKFDVLLSVLCEEGSPPWFCSDPKAFSHDLTASIRDFHAFCDPAASPDHVLAKTLKDRAVTENGDVYPAQVSFSTEKIQNDCALAGTVAHEGVHSVTPQESEPPDDIHDSEQADVIYVLGGVVEELCERSLLPIAP